MYSCFGHIVQMFRDDVLSPVCPERLETGFSGSKAIYVVSQMCTFGPASGYPEFLAATAAL